MHELYISWLGSYKQEMSNAMTANVKCILTWPYVAKKGKKYLYVPFLRIKFNCLKAKATTKFTEIPGTHFINLRRKKG